MNDILKQRLVGALILVALGVIFWPIIFVQPAGEEKAQQRVIPPPPVVASEPIEAPDRVGLRTSREIEARAAQERDTGDEAAAIVPAKPASTPPSETAAAASGAPEASAPPARPAAPADVQRIRTESPEALALDGDGVPLAWILQVASVSSADSADALRARLLQMNHKAYVKSVTRGGKNLYRVYIGPKFERDKLEQVQRNIDAEFGVSSMITRYVP